MLQQPIKPQGMSQGLLWAFANSEGVLQYVKDAGMSMHELDQTNTDYDLNSVAATMTGNYDPSAPQDWIRALSDFMMEAHMKHLEDNLEFRRDMADVYNKLASNILGDGTFQSKVYDTIFNLLRDEFPSRSASEVSKHACLAIVEKLNWNIPQAKYGNGSGGAPPPPPPKMPAVNLSTGQAIGAAPAPSAAPAGAVTPPATGGLAALLAAKQLKSSTPAGAPSAAPVGGAGVAPAAPAAGPSAGGSPSVPPAGAAPVAGQPSPASAPATGPVIGGASTGAPAGTQPSQSPPAASGKANLLAGIQGGVKLNPKGTSPAPKAKPKAVAKVWVFDAVSKKFEQKDEAPGITQTPLANLPDYAKEKFKSEKEYQDWLNYIEKKAQPEQDEEFLALQEPMYEIDITPGNRAQNVTPVAKKSKGDKKTFWFSRYFFETNPNMVGAVQNGVQSGKPPSIAQAPAKITVFFLTYDKFIALKGKPVDDVIEELNLLFMARDKSKMTALKFNAPVVQNPLGSPGPVVKLVAFPAPALALKIVSDKSADIAYMKQISQPEIDRRKKFHEEIEPILKLDLSSPYHSKSSLSFVGNETITRDEQTNPVVDDPSAPLTKDKPRVVLKPPQCAADFTVNACLNAEKMILLTSWVFRYVVPLMTLMFLKALLVRNATTADPDRLTFTSAQQAVITIFHTDYNDWRKAQQATGPSPVDDTKVAAWVLRKMLLWYAEEEKGKAFTKKSESQTAEFIPLKDYVEKEMKESDGAYLDKIESMAKLVYAFGNKVVGEQFKQPKTIEDFTYMQLLNANTQDISAMKQEDKEEDDAAGGLIAQIQARGKKKAEQTNDAQNLPVQLGALVPETYRKWTSIDLIMALIVDAFVNGKKYAFEDAFDPMNKKAGMPGDVMVLFKDTLEGRDVSVGNLIKMAEHIFLSRADMADKIFKLYDNPNFASGYPKSADANNNSMRMELAIHNVLLVEVGTFVSVSKNLIAELIGSADPPEGMTIYNLDSIGVIDEKMMRTYFENNRDKISIDSRLVMEPLIATELCEVDVDPVFEKINRVDMAIALQWIYGIYNVNHGEDPVTMMTAIGGKTPLMDAYQEVKKKLIAEFYQNRMRDMYKPFETDEEIKSNRGVALSEKLEYMILFDVISNAGRVAGTHAVTDSDDGKKDTIKKAYKELIPFIDAMLNQIRYVEAAAKAADDPVWMDFVKRNPKPAEQSLKDYVETKSKECLEDVLNTMPYYWTMIEDSKIKIIESKDVHKYAHDKPILQIVAHLKVKVVRPTSMPMIAVDSNGSAAKNMLQSASSAKSDLPKLDDRVAADSRMREAFMYVLRTIHTVNLNKLGDPDTFTPMIKNLRFIWNKHNTPSGPAKEDDSNAILFWFLLYPLAKQIHIDKGINDENALAMELYGVTIYKGLQDGGKSIMPYDAADHNTILEFAHLAINGQKYEDLIDQAILKDLKEQAITKYEAGSDYCTDNYASKLYDTLLPGTVSPHFTHMVLILMEVRLMWLYAPSMVMAMRKAVGPTPDTRSPSDNADSVKQFFMKCVDMLRSYKPDYTPDPMKTAPELAAASGFPYLPYLFHGPLPEDARNGLLLSRDWCYVISHTIFSMVVLPRLMFGERWADFGTSVKYPNFVAGSGIMLPLFGAFYMGFDVPQTVTGTPDPAVFKAAVTKNVKVTTTDRDPYFITAILFALGLQLSRYGLYKMEKLDINRDLVADFGLTIKNAASNVKELKETAVGIFNRLLTVNFAAKFTDDEVAEKVNGVWNIRTAEPEGAISKLSYIEAQTLRTIAGDGFSMTKYPANWKDYLAILNRVTPSADISSRNTYFNILEIFEKNATDWGEDESLTQNTAALAKDIPIDYKWQVAVAAGVLQLMASFTSASPSLASGAVGAAIAAVYDPCVNIDDVLDPRKTCALNSAEKANALKALQEKLKNADVWEGKILELLRTGKPESAAAFDLPIVMADPMETQKTAESMIRDIINFQKPGDSLLTNTVGSKNAVTDLWTRFEKYFITDGWKTAVRFVLSFRPDFAYEGDYVSLLYERYRQRKANDKLWNEIDDMYSATPAGPLKTATVTLHKKLMSILYTLIDIVNCAVITNKDAMPTNETELKANSLPRLRKWLKLRRKFEQQPPEFYDQFGIPPLPSKSDPHYYDVLDSLVMTYLYNCAQKAIEKGEAIAKKAAEEAAKKKAEEEEKAAQMRSNKKK